MKNEDYMFLWGGKLQGKRQLGRPRRKCEIQWILRLYDGKVWTGFIWLRLGTSDGLLWTR